MTPEQSQKAHEYYLATKAEKRQYERDNYAWLKRLHRCVDCKKQDAYTLNGRARCAECAEAQAAKRQEWREKGGKENEKLSRENRKAAFIANDCCSVCGSPILLHDSYKMCPSCRAKARRYDEKARMRRNPDVNFPRGANGYCWRCNKRPAVDGKRVCESCRKELVILAANAAAQSKGPKRIRL